MILKVGILDKDYINLYDFNSVPKNNFTLYAKWVPKIINIYYFDGDNKLLYTGLAIYGKDTNIMLVDSLSLPRKGYDGFWVDSNGEKFTSLTIKNQLVDISLYERYEKKSFTIKFVDYDGGILKTDYNIKYQESAVAPTSPKRVGYTFKGWDNDFSSIEDNMTISAIYEINYYNVTFLNNDNSLIEVRKIAYDTIIPTDINYTIIEGYTFSGWLDNSTDSYIDKILSDITLKASYKINEYQVVFCDYDGSILSSQTISYNSSAIPPNEPSSRGAKYKFIGWDKSFTNINQNLTIKANYKMIKCTITFNSNNGQSSVITNVDFECDKMIGENMPSLSPTKPNYFMGGWNTSSDGLGIVVDKSFIPTDDLVVYTDWYEQINSNWIVSNNMLIGYLGNAKKVCLPIIDGVSIIGNGTNFITGLNINSTSSINDKILPKTSIVTDIIIPKGYIKVNNYAFYNIYGLDNVRFTLDSTCTEIGDYAFASNADFYSNYLYSKPYNSNTKQNEYSIDYYSIKSIRLPSSLETLGSKAFLMSINLEDISMEVDNSSFSTLNGVLYNGDKTELIAYPQNKKNSTFEILSSVKSINDYAFCYGGRIVNNDESSFDSLTSLTFEKDSNLTKIGNFAFEGRKNLINIDFLNASKLISLGECAFNFCGNKNYDFTNSILLENIGNNCFTCFYNGYYNYYNDGYMQSYTYKNSFIESIKLNTTSLKNIGDGAFFSSKKLTEIVLPNSLTIIGKFAFYNSNLSSIVLPNSLNDLGIKAFKNCSSLKTLTLSNSLKVLGDNVFDNCSALETINLSKNIDTISSTSFLTTSSIKNFGVDSENLNFKAVDGVLYTYDLKELVAYPENKNLESYHTLESTEIIRSYAFYNSKNLKNIYFDNSLKLSTISAYAFQNSVINMQLIITPSIENIGDYAFSSTQIVGVTILDGSKFTYLPNNCFESCIYLNNVVYEGSSLVTSYKNSVFRYCRSLVDNTKFILPESLISLSGYDILLGTGLETLAITKNINNIYCDSSTSNSPLYSGKLKTLTIDSNNTTFAVTNGILYKGTTLFYCPECIEVENNILTISSSIDKINNIAFNGNKTLTKIVLSSVSSIGGYAFAYSNIASIDFSNSNITSITGGSFFNCQKLQNINFGNYSNNITMIEYYAFYNCVSLTSISIPSKITYIGSSAFYQCSNLLTVNLLSKVPFKIENNTFNNKNTNFKTLGSSVATNYKNNEYWKYLASQIS
jgi:hypothetical protein